MRYVQLITSKKYSPVLPHVWFKSLSSPYPGWWIKELRIPNDSQLIDGDPQRSTERVPRCLQQSSTVRLHEDARVARQKQVVDSPKVIGLGQIQPRGFRASPMAFGRS